MTTPKTSTASVPSASRIDSGSNRFSTATGNAAMPSAKTSVIRPNRPGGDNLQPGARLAEAFQRRSRGQQGQSGICRQDIVEQLRRHRFEHQPGRDDPGQTEQHGGVAPVVPDPGIAGSASSDQGQKVTETAGYSIRAGNLSILPPATLAIMSWPTHLAKKAPWVLIVIRISHGATIASITGNPSLGRSGASQPSPRLRHRQP